MAHLFFAGDGTPLSKPEDVIPFLGKREKHWKVERSAYQTAYSWFDAKGIPATIRAILGTDSVLAEAQFEKAYFERQTNLDDTGRGPSQTDVLVFVKVGTGPAILGIEGKVDEPFGELVSDWNDYSPGKLRRLAGLIDKLNLKYSKSIGSLRYQLLHRTVATLLEAKSAKANEAAVIVQSFDVKGTAGFGDFQMFANALGTPVSETGKLSAPIELDGIRIRLGWTTNGLRVSS